jgi:hypothetical protein
MMASAQPGAGSNHVRAACMPQPLRIRYRAAGTLRRAINFAGGVAIGGIIALFFWLMVG